MSKLGWGLIAAVLVTSGCRFDPSGPAAAGDGAVALPDARLIPDAAPADGGSSSCAKPISVAISVDGIAAPPQPQAPFEQVLVGDTVALSAAGSCVQNGPISYTWQITPTDGTRATAEPGLDAKTLTVYPVLPTQYVVMLTVTDGAGNTASSQVYGFEAHAFSLLPGTLQSSEIRGLDVGSDRLWVASKDGAYDASILNFQGFTAVNSTFSGDTVDGDVGTVLAGPNGAVWYGDQMSWPGVWQASPTANQVTEIDFGQDSVVRGIGPGGEGNDGIAFATDHGVFSIPGGTTVKGPFAPSKSDLWAATASKTRAWCGGNRLYDVDDASFVADPLSGSAGMDDKIRALTVYNNELWIGTDGNGVVQASATSGAPAHVYTAANSALPSDHIRAIAVEQSGRFAGDVWVATDMGVARFKRDRGVWFAMGNNHGLAMRTDVRAIVSGEYDGERAIYAGTVKGVVYISVR